MTHHFLECRWNSNHVILQLPNHTHAACCVSWYELVQVSYPYLDQSCKKYCNLIGQHQIYKSHRVLVNSHRVLVNSHRVPVNLHRVPVNFN